MSGHNPSAEIPDFEIDDKGCWQVAGPRYFGYGRWRRSTAHRAIYLEVVGPIPDGYQVDHLCHDPQECEPGEGCTHRGCINPDHLEAVSPAVNTYRSGNPFAVNARKTHCKRGHEFTPENTTLAKSNASGRFQRVCRKCAAAKQRAYLSRKKVTA